MDKINFKNCIKSFFLGVLIGAALQIYEHVDASISDRALALLLSGGIGFAIGLITEWLTSILPIRLAKARTYFMINNMIALVVTALIVGLLLPIAAVQPEGPGELIPVLILVLGIVCVANLFDYWMYRRAQKKLEAFKAELGER